MAISIESVRLIYDEETELTDDQIQGFIDFTVPWTTEVFSNAGVSVSSATKDIIDNYVTAHFMNIKDGKITQEKMGNGSEKKNVAVESSAKSLNITEYGKQAIGFDTSGTLADVAEAKQTADIYAVDIDLGYQDYYW
jgi:hypothetical protein